MTSPLTAGLKFRQTGFNRTSTPAGPSKSEDDIANSLPRKTQFPESPTAGVYDIANTSSRLIILNNANKARLGSKLRLYASTERMTTPDPERHQRYKTSQNDPKRHIKCNDSSSPSFEPSPPTSIKWKNQNQRPAWKPSEDSSKNNERHWSCMVSNHPMFTSLEYTGHEALTRKQQKLLIHRQPSSRYITYLMHISQAYDISQTRQQKYAQYLRLLMKQEDIGFHSEKEYDSYMRFINKRFCGSDTTSQRSRPVSTVSHKKTTQNSAKQHRSKSAKVQSSSGQSRDKQRNSLSTDNESDNDGLRQDTNRRKKDKQKEDRVKVKNDKGVVRETHVFQRPKTAAVQKRGKKANEEYSDTDDDGGDEHSSAPRSNRRRSSVSSSSSSRTNSPDVNNPSRHNRGINEHARKLSHNSTNSREDKSNHEKGHRGSVGNNEDENNRSPSPAEQDTHQPARLSSPAKRNEDDDAGSVRKHSSASVSVERKQSLEKSSSERSHSPANVKEEQENHKDSSNSRRGSTRSSED